MNWFEDWFDSPYYHLLYSHRNDEEAYLFMQNLLDYLKPIPHSRILDLACGKGRHAQFIAQMGHYVTGVDLSDNSIEEAKLKNNANLEFFKHDMRFPFRIGYYDYVFNLFTSFGYFNNSRAEFNTIRSAVFNLKPRGILVIDFFNVQKVKQNIQTHQQFKTIGNVHFSWVKKIENNSVIKEITVNDNQQIHHYREQVHLLSLANFKAYFHKAGLTLTTCFGDYKLSPFHEEKSDRLIMIAQKD